MKNFISFIILFIGMSSQTVTFISMFSNCVDPFIILCACHHDRFINMTKMRLISDTDARAYLRCISSTNKLGFSQIHLALTIINRSKFENNMMTMYIFVSSERTLLCGFQSICKQKCKHLVRCKWYN